MRTDEAGTDEDRAEELLRRLRDEDSWNDTTLLLGPDRTPRRERRRLRPLAGLTAAAVLAVLFVVALGGYFLGRPAARSGGPSQIVAAVPAVPRVAGTQPSVAILNEVRLGKRTLARLERNPSVAAAEDRAARLVVTARLPQGAHRLSANPATSRLLSASFPECTPLVEATTYWRVPGSKAARVQHHLATHPTRGFTEQGTGSAGDHDVTDSWQVSEQAKYVSADEKGAPTLQYSLIRLHDGAVALRVDVQIIPANAECVTSGGPPARSTPAR